MRNQSYENVFCLLVSFYANQIHYHMKAKLRFFSTTRFETQGL